MTSETLPDDQVDLVVSGTDEAAAGAPMRRRLRRGRSFLVIAAFLTPGLALFCLLVLTPIVVAAYTSLYKWNGFNSPTDFIGLENFTRALQDEVFQSDLWHMAVIILLSLVVQLPLSLALAMLLNQPLRGRSVYRVVFFAPYVLSEVITAVLFTMVFSPSLGLALPLFDAIGQGDFATRFLSDPDLVLYSMFFVITWKYFGFHMILYLAGRQNIPNELVEAAATEGATGWQTFRFVTLPLLGPTIRISIFLSIIGAIQLFDLVWVLTGGGPVHATETMAVTMYNFGFKRSQVGYASAISIIMFLISFIFALAYQRFVLRRDTEGATTTMGGQR